MGLSKHGPHEFTTAVALALLGRMMETCPEYTLFLTMVRHLTKDEGPIHTARCAHKLGAHCCFDAPQVRQELIKAVYADWDFLEQSHRYMSGAQPYQHITVFTRASLPDSSRLTNAQKQGLRSLR